MARRRLPGFVAEYLDGGSEDELTLHNNRDAFTKHRFVHRVAVDVSKTSTASTLFGTPCGMPLAIGPTGFNGLFWKEGDIALARAARANNIPFTISIVSNDSMEAIAEKAGGRLWLMMTPIRDPAVRERMMARAENIGCEALVVTLDCAGRGNRTWHHRDFAEVPKSLSLRSKLDVLHHLRWLFSVFFPRGVVGFGNLAEFLPAKQRKALPGAKFLAVQGDISVTWESLRAIRERWKRKLVLNGVLAVSDAEEAARLGVDGIVLSNHGGRQLDCDAAPLDMLESVVAAVGQRLEVMLDGGFRRGTDVVKALALGARAVLLGRATLYGLAAGGEAGAARALEILRSEIVNTLSLLGRPSIDKLSPAVLFGRQETRAAAIDLEPGRLKLAARDA